jgi:hypothetical protein
VEGQPVTEYDPREVPILAELEEEFRLMVAETLTPVALGAPAMTPAPATGPEREPTRWLRTGRRILGRAAVAGALVGVVGATALATKSVVHRDSAAPEPRVLQRAEGHELTLRHYRGKLCLDISLAAAVASRCSEAPAAGDVSPLSAIVPGGRMVAGIAGANVARVRIGDGKRSVDVATRPVGGTQVRGLRWFAAHLPPPRGRPAAAIVTPRRASGAPAGRPVADCTLGSFASCSAARARATREHS